MKVKILFFASLREQLGSSGEEVDLPAAVTTIDELRAHLRSRGGVYEKMFSGKTLVRAEIGRAHV